MSDGGLKPGKPVGRPIGKPTRPADVVERRPDTNTQDGFDESIEALWQRGATFLLITRVSDEELLFEGWFVKPAFTDDGAAP